LGAAPRHAYNVGRKAKAQQAFTNWGRPSVSVPVGSFAELCLDLGVALEPTAGGKDLGWGVRGVLRTWASSMPFSLASLLSVEISTSYICY
jgi:hypothetical protein